jgi:hypothetical protein
MNITDREFQKAFFNGAYHGALDNLFSVRIKFVQPPAQNLIFPLCKIKVMVSIVAVTSSSDKPSDINQSDY